MIWTGAFQNVAVASGTTDLNGKAITASWARRRRLSSEPGVPQERLRAGDGADGQAARSARGGAESHNGVSVRLIPTYDGTNDRSNFRLDCLYGVKAIDPRLATRLSGMCLTREVFARLKDAYPERGYSHYQFEGHAFFHAPVVNGRLYGEDTRFCADWTELGGKVWLDPELKLTHHGGSVSYPGHIGEWLKARPPADPQPDTNTERSEH
jgi:hypothetical protein